MYDGPPREGNRGGKDLFKWDNVKHDKYKECYLGYSSKLVNISTFNNRHPNQLWYANKERTLPNAGSQEQRAAEIAALRKAEQDMIDEALGIKKKKTVDDTPKLDEAEIRELTRRQGGAEVDEGVRIQGLGYAPAPHHEGIERELLPGAAQLLRQQKSEAAGTGVEVQSAVEGTVQEGEDAPRRPPGGGPVALPTYKQYKKLPKEQRKTFPKELLKQIKKAHKAEKKAAKKAAKKEEKEKKRKRKEESSSSSSESEAESAGSGPRRKVGGSPPRRRADDSPPRRRTSDSRSPPRRRPSASPPRRRADDSPPRRRPSASPPRRSPSASPPRRRPARDSPSPPRRRPSRSPPRRKAADDSPPRRPRHESPPRVEAPSPPRRRSRSPPRRRSRSRSRSPPRRR